jgi:hypothetical protein
MIDENRPLRNKTPSKESGAALLLAGKSLENYAFFVTEKQPTSIATGWSEPVCRAGIAPAGVQRLSTAHFFNNCLSNRYNFIEFRNLMVAPS